jgi:pyridoxal phosphate enzyme (YggS family)
MSALATHVAANVAAVRARIAAATAAAGRSADSVRLVAVTKSVGPEAIRAVVAAGCADLAESRPQQLWQRAVEFAGGFALEGPAAPIAVRWHLVGHLQRNKVRRTLPLTALIHSLDSLRLAAAINEDAAAPVPVLLEVNVAGEAAKTGLPPEAVAPLLPALAALPRLAVRGLMCMAAWESTPAEARRQFAALRALRERLRADCPPQVVLDELSMGMSGDFEQAIAEGATIVRIGSALFEGADA